MASDVIEPGSILDGKWRVEHPLGEGGMAAVYAASHVRNGLQVAIKVLFAKLAKDPGVRERFLHEGYAANRVGHAGTVQVLDDGTTPDGVVYLVMERLVGESISGRAERLGGALEPAEAIAIAEASLETLAAAHRAGIVHRDFKPENLFLTKDGAIKILDFGLARVFETTRHARLTVEGVLMGTPAFMPPEQAQANWAEVDARSDVYSVGASLWTLMSGRLVHEGATALQILVKVSTQPAQPLQTYAPTVPDKIADVFDRALVKDRQGRWADAEEMLTALRAAINETGFVPGNLKRIAAEAFLSTTGGVPSAKSLAAGARADAPSLPVGSAVAEAKMTAHPATPRMKPLSSPEPPIPAPILESVVRRTPDREDADVDSDGAPTSLRSVAVTVGMPGSQRQPPPAQIRVDPKTALMPMMPAGVPVGAGPTQLAPQSSPYGPPTPHALHALSPSAQQQALVHHAAVAQSQMSARAVTPAPAAYGAANGAQLQGSGVKTISPTSSGTAPRRRASNALVVSVALVAVAIVGFVVALLVFRERWKKDKGNETARPRETHTPTATPATATATPPPSHPVEPSAAPSAAASASASAPAAATATATVSAPRKKGR